MKGGEGRWGEVSSAGGAKAAVHSPRRISQEKDSKSHAVACERPRSAPQRTASGGH